MVSRFENGKVIGIRLYALALRYEDRVILVIKGFLFRVTAAPEVGTVQKLISSVSSRRTLALSYSIRTNGWA